MRPDPAARRRERRGRGVMPACCAALRYAGSGERRARGRSRCAKAAPSDTRTARPLPMPARLAPLDLPCVPPLAAPASLTRMLPLPRQAPQKVPAAEAERKGAALGQGQGSVLVQAVQHRFFRRRAQAPLQTLWPRLLRVLPHLLRLRGTLCCRCRPVSASAGRSFSGFSLQPAARVSQSTLASEVTHGGGEQTLLFQQADAHQVWLLEACASVQQMQRFVLQGRSSPERGVYIARRAHECACAWPHPPLGSPKSW